MDQIILKWFGHGWGVRLREEDKRKETHVKNYTEQKGLCLGEITSVVNNVPLALQRMYGSSDE